jgi:anhydro-N-acetylmuramic acid kinase
MKSSIYHVIGLMSGSSLDGLDIAYCVLQQVDGQWQYHIDCAACIPYNSPMAARLAAAATLSGRELWQLHTDLSYTWAAAVSSFIADYELGDTIDFIASHGHTVFHYPDSKMTAQIGEPAVLATGTGVAVVAGFRTADMALGGQGTPIVPIGDRLLFTDYDLLLNIGGIANITIKQPTGIIAYDICAANQVLNHYARALGHEYDAGGEIAASGSISQLLLDQLQALPYYRLPAPKSLDNSYSLTAVIPLIDSYGLSPADALCTYSHHLAQQIASQQILYPLASRSKMLVTGGGALNQYLIDTLRTLSKLDIIVPDVQTVMYKEALVMALMGVLRWRGQTNVLHTVTGATRDTCGGAIYLPSLSPN